MKKFINDQNDLVDELLEGYALANSDKVHLVDGRIVVSNALDEADRVTIVSIGGSGHEPCACGYVGQGLLDVFAAGEIFVAPDADEALRAVQLADRGKGVLLVILNHAGDMLAGKTVAERCASLGLRLRVVVTQEDISSAPRSDAANRRGLVGCVPVYKVAAAAAAQGRDLDDVAAVAQRLSDQMATLAVATEGATNPVTGRLLAEFGEDDMEIGMGQHGEEGGGRLKLPKADDVAAIMLEALLDDLQVKPGEKVMLMINGSGSTTLMEQFIVYRRCHELLAEKSVDVVANRVGNILTVQEQAGFQMFLARMDDELLELWNAPCDAPYFKRS